MATGSELCQRIYPKNLKKKFSAFFTKSSKWVWNLPLLSVRKYKTFCVTLRLHFGILMFIYYLLTIMLSFNFLILKITFKISLYKKEQTVKILQFSQQHATSRAFFIFQVLNFTSFIFILSFCIKYIFLKKLIWLFHSILNITSFRKYRFQILVLTILQCS